MSGHRCQFSTASADKFPSGRSPSRLLASADSLPPTAGKGGTDQTLKVIADQPIGRCPESNHGHRLARMPIGRSWLSPRRLRRWTTGSLVTRVGVEPTKSQVLGLLALPICVPGRFQKWRVRGSHPAGRAYEAPMSTGPPAASCRFRYRAGRQTFDQPPVGARVRRAPAASVKESSAQN